jgi:hypothetical protein
MSILLIEFALSPTPLPKGEGAEYFLTQAPNRLSTSSLID